MRIKIIFSGIIASLAILIIIASCNTDQFDFDNLSSQISINHDISVPLAHGEVSTKDLLESIDSAGYVNEDLTGLLYLAYSDTMLSKTAEEEFQIMDQNLSEIFYESDDDVPTGAFIEDTTIVRDELHSLDLDMDDSLVTITFDEFTLEQEIDYSFSNYARIVMIYDSLLLDGEPFKDTIEIEDMSGNYQETRSHTLYGYTLKIANPDTSDKAYVPVHYEFTIENSGNPIESGDYLSIDSRLINIDFKSATGYIGKDTLLAENTDIPIELFEEFDGYIEFKDPQFNFLISNSYGIPVDVALENAKAYVTDPIDSFPITFTESPYEIGYPAINQDPVEPVETSIEINNSTCDPDLTDILADQPNRMAFDASIVANPDGNTGELNFFYDYSTLDVITEIVLPLELRANNFSLNDTSDMDLEETIGDLDMIKSMKGKLKVINGLPVVIDFQVYFTDENYNLVDSLFTADQMPVIQGAQVDNDGNVLSPTTKYSESSFDEDGFENLKSVKYAIFNVNLNTSDFADDITVKFYSDSKVKFKFDIDAQTNIH